MILRPLSLIYSLIVKARSHAYQSKIFKSNKLTRPVIVVGNITVGGTGKTPFVDYILQVLQSRDVPAGVISRGYKGEYKGIAEVSLNNKNATQVFGDEPILLKRRNAKTPIYLCGNRFQAGDELIKKSPNVKMVICDDGFQHFALESDLKIVLIDCTEDLANYKMLPEGRLREPLSGLKRANHIVFTKVNWASNSQLQEVKRLVSTYKNLHDQNYSEACYSSIFPELESKNIIVVSSIAKPDMFYNNVKNSNKYEVKGQLVYKDHHSYTKNDIKDIKSKLNESDASFILTTEKDYVKLCQYNEIKDQVKVVEIKVELTSGKESLNNAIFNILS